MGEDAIHILLLLNEFPLSINSQRKGNLDVYNKMPIAKSFFLFALSCQGNVNLTREVLSKQKKDCSHYFQISSRNLEHLVAPDPVFHPV